MAPAPRTTTNTQLTLPHTRGTYAAATAGAIAFGWPAPKEGTAPMAPKIVPSPYGERLPDEAFQEYRRIAGVLDRSVYEPIDSHHRGPVRSEDGRDGMAMFVKLRDPDRGPKLRTMSLEITQSLDWDPQAPTYDMVAFYDRRDSEKYVMEKHDIPLDGLHAALAEVARDFR